MANEPLTDAHLDEMLRDNEGVDGPTFATGHEVTAMAAEIRRLRARLAVVERVFEAAKEWHGARCSRMPSCDPYDGSHDAECLLAIAESWLTNAIDAALAASKESPNGE